MVTEEVATAIILPHHLLVLLWQHERGGRAEVEESYRTKFESGSVFLIILSLMRFRVIRVIAGKKVDFNRTKISVDS